MAEFFWRSEKNELTAEGAASKLIVKFYFRQEESERNATQIYLSLPSSLSVGTITPIPGAITSPSHKGFDGKGMNGAFPLWDNTQEKSSLLFAEFPAGKFAGEANQHHQALLGWSIELIAGATDKMSGHEVRAWAIKQTATKPSAEMIQKLTILPTPVDQLSVRLMDDPGIYHDATNPAAPFTWLSKTANITISGKTNVDLKHAFVSLKIGEHDWSPLKNGEVSQGDRKTFTLTSAFDPSSLPVGKKTVIQVKVCQVSDDTRETGSAWSKPDALTVDVDATAPNPNTVETFFSDDILKLYAQFTDTDSGVSKVEFLTKDMAGTWKELDGPGPDYSVTIPDDADLTQGIKVRATDKVGNITNPLPALIDPGVVEVTLNNYDKTLRQDGLDMAEISTSSSLGMKFPQLDFDLESADSLLHFSPSHIKDALHSQPWISFSFDKPTLYGKKVTGLQYKIEKGGFYKEGLYDVIILPEDTIYAPPIPDFDLDNNTIIAQPESVKLVGHFLSPPVAWDQHPIEFQYSVDEKNSVDEKSFFPASVVVYTPGDHKFSVELPAESFSKEQKYKVLLRAEYQNDEHFDTAAAISDTVAAISDTVAATITITKHAATLIETELAVKGGMLTATGTAVAPQGSNITDVQVAINWTGQGAVKSTDWVKPLPDGKFNIQTAMNQVHGFINPIFYTKIGAVETLIGHYMFRDSTGLVDVKCEVAKKAVVFSPPEIQGEKLVRSSPSAPITIPANTEFVVSFTVEAKVGIQLMNAKLKIGDNLTSTKPPKAIPKDLATKPIEGWDGQLSEEIYAFDKLSANVPYTVEFTFKAKKDTAAAAFLSFSLVDPEATETAVNSAFNMVTNYQVQLKVS